MKKNLTSSTQTAGANDQAERAQRTGVDVSTGATPRSGTLPPATNAIFTATVRRLLDNARDCVANCESTPEAERGERVRIMLLEMIAASNMPFPEFHERMFSLAPDAARDYSEMLETLAALSDAESEAAR